MTGPYVPLDLNVYSAAFAGGMAGMVNPYGAAIVDPVSADYEPFAIVANVWAQAVDVAWAAAGMGVPNSYDVACIELLSKNYHDSHPIGPSDLPAFGLQTNWTIPATALVAAIREGDINLSGQGITPPPYPPPGPTGPTGPTGPAGPTGATGATGATGSPSILNQARGVVLVPLPTALDQFVLADVVGSNDGITYVLNDIVVAMAESAGTYPLRAGPYQIISVNGGLGTLQRPSWWQNGDTLKTGDAISLGSEGKIFSNVTLRAMGPVTDTPGHVTAPGPSFEVGTVDPGLYPEQITTQTTLTSGTVPFVTPILSQGTAVSVIDVETRPDTTLYYKVELTPGDYAQVGRIYITAMGASEATDTNNENDINVAVFNTHYWMPS